VGWCNFKLPEIWDGWQCCAHGVKHRHVECVERSKLYGILFIFNRSLFVHENSSPVKREIGYMTVFWVNQRKQCLARGSARLYDERA